jgi:hypothetical protein
MFGRICRTSRMDNEAATDYEAAMEGDMGWLDTRYIAVIVGILRSNEAGTGEKTS